VIDKQRCWWALNLTDWYNRHSDFFYNHVYGDKDTFRLAWHKVGQVYAMPTRDPDFIPFAMCQYDFADELLFQHRIHDKWSLLGNRRVAEFRHEEICLRFLAELREKWSPVGHLLHKLTSDERCRMSLIGRHNYRFVHVGLGGRAMQLADTGCIQAGASPTEAFWSYHDEALTVMDAGGKPTARLSEQNDGSWFGRTLDNGKRLVRLVRIRR